MLGRRQPTSKNVVPPGGSPSAGRGAPTAPPPRLPALNELLTSATNAAKVAAHVKRVEREAQALCKRLEDTLHAMAAGAAIAVPAPPTTGAVATAVEDVSMAASDVPTEAFDGSDGSVRNGVPSAADPLSIDPAASPTATAADLVSASPRSPASVSLLSLPIPPAATLTAQAAPAARRRALEARRAHVAALRAKLDAEQAALQAQRTGVMARRQALLPKLATLQAAHKTQLAHRETLERQARKHVSELRLQLHLLQLRQASRRRALLLSLQQIYPLSPPPRSSQHPLMCYMIRGLRLPNNFNNILTSFEEEQVSTALGYVCHLILLIAKYLDVPLRYRMIYRSSRSVICDDVTASSQFPLYFKNMEERRFELGVILLNKNIEHLLHVRLLERGSSYAKYMRELTFTLENIEALFKAELKQ